MLRPLPIKPSALYKLTKDCRMLILTVATELRQGAVTPRTSAASSPGADADEFILQHTATVSQSLSRKHTLLQEVRSDMFLSASLNA